MSSQRIPLANNPNAVNSPYRSALASKRAREHGIDLEKDNSPPKKRQMLTRDTATYRRAQKISLNEPEGKVFTERRPHAPQQTLFQQRLLAAQQDRQGTTATGGEKSGQKQLAPEIEQINHWRRHYRRVFPGFVIYFDNLSADVALQLKRSVLKLGGVCQCLHPLLKLLSCFALLTTASVKRISSPRTSRILSQHVQHHPVARRVTPEIPKILSTHQC